MSKAEASSNWCLPVLPVSGVCRSRDVRTFLGIALETWNLWKAAGLEVIGSVSTKLEYVDLSVLAAFLRSSPKLARRPNRRKRNAVTQ